MEDDFLPPTHHGDYCGFDMLGVDEDELGFDYMALLKGAGGMLSGAGGMMGQPGATPAATEAERLRLQMEKEAAERSARTWKIVGGIVLAALGIGGVALLMRKPAVAPVKAA